jgi:hypothetical protein
LIFNSEINHSINKISEFNKVDNSYFFINILKKTNILKIYNINFSVLIKNCIECFSQIINIHYRYNFNKTVRKILLSRLIFRITNFIIYVSIFNSLKKKNVNCEIYSGGIFFISLASIKNDFKTFYYSHGFIGKFYNILYPKFNCTYVFSNEEKKILKKNNPNMNISVYNYKRITNHVNTIIIYIRGNDNNINDKKGFEIYRNLINFFISEKYKIYVKLHPLYAGKYFNKNNNDFTVIKKKYINNSELLNDIKPKFVISWYSSVLAESLYSNIIPINLITSDKIKADEKIKYGKKVDILEWILYPIEKKTLNWEKDRNKIKQLVNDKNIYQNVIDQLIYETNY